MCLEPIQSKEGIRSPRTGETNGFKPVGAGNQIWVLYNSNKYLAIESSLQHQLHLHPFVTCVFVSMHVCMCINTEPEVGIMHLPQLLSTCLILDRDPGASSSARLQESQECSITPNLFFTWAGNQAQVHNLPGKRFTR